MTKHTFSMQQAYENMPATSHETTTDAETINDILDAFVLHLRGCGFHVNEGEIEFLRKEKSE